MRRQKRHVTLISQWGEYLNETRQPPFDLRTGNHFDLRRIHPVWLLPFQAVHVYLFSLHSACVVLPGVSIVFTGLSWTKGGGIRCRTSDCCEVHTRLWQKRGFTGAPVAVPAFLLCPQTSGCRKEWRQRRDADESIGRLGIDRGPRVPLRCALPPRKNEQQNIAFSNACGRKPIMVCVW